MPTPTTRIDQSLVHALQPDPTYNDGNDDCDRQEAAMKVNAALSFIPLTQDTSRLACN